MTGLKKMSHFKNKYGRFLLMERGCFLSPPDWLWQELFLKTPALFHGFHPFSNMCRRMTSQQSPSHLSNSCNGLLFPASRTQPSTSMSCKCGFNISCSILLFLTQRFCIFQSRGIFKLTCVTLIHSTVSEGHFVKGFGH